MLRSRAAVTASSSTASLAAGTSGVTRNMMGEKCPSGVDDRCTVRAVPVDAHPHSASAGASHTRFLMDYTLPREDAGGEMSHTAAVTSINHQFRLAARPVGMAKRSDFSWTEEPVPEPKEGELVVEILYVSLDPAMRGWMNEGRSYIPPVALGEVMRAGGAGRVVA